MKRLSEALEWGRGVVATSAERHPKHLLTSKIHMPFDPMWTEGNSTSSGWKPNNEFINREADSVGCSLVNGETTRSPEKRDACTPVFTVECVRIHDGRGRL